MDSTISTNKATKYAIQENSKSTSATHVLRRVHPRDACCRSVMQKTA